MKGLGRRTDERFDSTRLGSWYTLVVAQKLSSLNESTTHYGVGDNEDDSQNWSMEVKRCRASTRFPLFWEIKLSLQFPYSSGSLVRLTKADSLLFIIIKELPTCQYHRHQFRPRSIEWEGKSSSDWKSAHGSHTNSSSTLALLTILLFSRGNVSRSVMREDDGRIPGRSCFSTYLLFPFYIYPLELSFPPLKKSFSPWLTSGALLKLERGTLRPVSWRL